MSNPSHQIVILGGNLLFFFRHLRETRKFLTHLKGTQEILLNSYEIQCQTIILNFVASQLEPLSIFTFKCQLRKCQVIYKTKQNPILIKCFIAGQHCHEKYSCFPIRSMIIEALFFLWNFFLFLFFFFTFKKSTILYVQLDEL